MNNPSMKRRLAAVFGCTLLAAATSAFAENSCKGLEKSPCASKGSCTWIDAYTTKKGSTVDGYCRSANKKAKAEVAAKPAKTGATALKQPSR